jgi:hypothetical protein
MPVSSHTVRRTIIRFWQYRTSRPTIATKRVITDTHVVYNRQPRPARCVKADSAMHQAQYPCDLGDSPTPLPPREPTGLKWSLAEIFRAVFQVTIWSLAFIGLATMLRETLMLRLGTASASEVKSVSCSCGENVAEAISKGCKYDLLASAWLPAQCRDDELSAEFDRAGPGLNGEWTYVSAPWIRCHVDQAKIETDSLSAQTLTHARIQFADIDGSRTMNASDIGAMADLPGFLYYTTLEWHMVHCYFYWIKAWRTRETGSTIEKRYDTEKHIRHCSKVLMTKDADLQAVKTSQGASLMSGEEPVVVTKRKQE